MHGQARRSLPKRILYIDDDPHFVILVKYMMGRLGHRVTGFESAEEALEALALHPHRWDVVITDFRMPGWSGLDVAKALRDRHPEMPYAVISTCVDDELMHDAQAAGVGPVLVKPERPQEFEALLKRIGSWAGVPA